MPFLHSVTLVLVHFNLLYQGQETRNALAAVEAVTSTQRSRLLGELVPRR
jgi:hypothetical protein